MALARIQTNLVKILTQLGYLTESQSETILSTPGDLPGEAMDELLRNEYHLTDFQLLIGKSRLFDIRPFNVKNYRVNERTFEKLDKDFCRENMVLPIGVVGKYIVVVVSNPFNLQISNKVQEITRMQVTVLLGIEEEIKAKFENEEGPEPMEGLGEVIDALGVDVSEKEDVSEEDFSDEDSAPIIQLANRIIEDAYYSGGSDVHLDPFENDSRVRVRVDGKLQEKLRIPKKVSGALMARFKVMSELDIAEKRKPQDGRIVFKQFNRRGLDIDLRVSTAPLNHGEGIVMRILDKQKSTLALDALGYSERNLTLYTELIQRPYGMILHCGPTGSGKSMTLYSALNVINSPEICIRTAEDPIEYTLPGLAQMQMKPKIGLTFASALRAFLRQDPDIILVGEIRDRETAQIAVEAALTGHMLFSTLHTNDAPSTVQRLTEMGIEPFMISASLVCVCAQRLLRRVNKATRIPYEPVGNEKQIIERALGWSGQIYKASDDPDSPAGPPYKGRVGIHELMSVSEELNAAINEGAETAKLKEIAMKNGMRTLHQDSLLKVKEGLTTLKEALGTVPPDLEDLEAIRKTQDASEAREREEAAAELEAQTVAAG